MPAINIDQPKNLTRNISISDNERQTAELYLNRFKEYAKTRLHFEFSDEEALAYCYQKLLTVGDPAWTVFQKVYNLDKIILNNYSLLKTANKNGIKPNVYFQTEKIVVDNLIEVLNRNFSLVNKIHPTDFEFVVARLLEKLNYRVEVTSQTRDGGFDIIALSGDKLPVKQLIECKRYKNKVDVSIIRSFLYVIDKEKVNQGVLFTTSTYTKDAMKEANQFGHKIHLVDSNKLQTWIRENVEQDSEFPF